ncbi:MAG TPA: nitrilase-related carbon-nitrogen hydrolase [Conexibacter sp.]|jgi:predicted amidohydrolase|nr:nitrilase-related carbon-nitrogen hydrolase [Conexibacter sp.]
MTGAAAPTIVACAQLAPRLGEVEHNVAIACDAIRVAADLGARVVVLPELAATGYAFASREEALAIARRDGGRSVEAWTVAAQRHDVVVVGGFCELARDGTLYNSAAVLDASGTRAVYRKAHLWNREQLIFAPGEVVPPVVETDAGRIAVGICYDVYFPDLVAGIAARGAELLCLPTNAPRHLPGEAVPPAAGGYLYPAQLSLYIALAHIYRIFIAACDRVGDERGIEWIGGSAVVDHRGWVLAGPPPAYGEGVIAGACELALAREKRRSERNHVFDDARAGVLRPAPTMEEDT